MDGLRIRESINFFNENRKAVEPKMNQTKLGELVLPELDRKAAGHPYLLIHLILAIVRPPRNCAVFFIYISLKYQADQPFALSICQQLGIMINGS